MMTNIFQPNGNLRTDLETVADQVPPQRRPQFDALVEAVKAADAAEARSVAAEGRLAAAVKAHQDALAAAPKSTFMDEWRAMVASGNR